jgi:hypothetical protein
LQDKSQSGASKKNTPKGVNLAGETLDTHGYSRFTKKNVENRNMLMPDHKKSWFSGKQFLTILLYLSVSIYMYCYSIHKMWCVQTMLLSLKCQKPTETCFISLAKRVKSCSPNMFHASDSTTSCCPKPASYPTGVSL